MQLIALLIIAVLAFFFAAKNNWFGSDTVEVVAQIEAAAVPVVAAAASELRSTRELVHRKSAFAAIVDRFEGESTGLTRSLETGKTALLDFKETIRLARDRDAEFDKVYAHWETVEEKTARLREHFRSLVSGADDFYTAIIAHAESISDERLRAESLAFIEKSQNTYAQRLEETMAAIASVNAMKTKVDDTLKALEIRFAVEIVDQRLGEIFAEIDRMVEEVLSALRALESESQQVLGNLG